MTTAPLNPPAEPSPLARAFNWVAYKRHRPAVIRLIAHLEADKTPDPSPSDQPPCTQSDRDFDDKPKS